MQTIDSVSREQAMPEAIIVQKRPGRGMLQTFGALRHRNYRLFFFGQMISLLDVITPISTTITAARAAAIPVIYVSVNFRPGYPEINPKNKSFGAIKQQRQVSQSATMPSMEIHPTIVPQSNDIVVTKRRVSAFSGSDLEVVLRSQDISHLVLCGISTSGVVLSTLREAADKDYQLTVLADCCADGDEEVQRVLLSKVFPRQADVVQSAAWRAQF